MRKGFTMIELIFVIVILGILAAVAIPRLAATRDDAQISKSLSELSTVMQDITSYYTSQGKFASAAENMTNVKVTGTPSNTAAFTLAYPTKLTPGGCVTFKVDTNDTHKWVEVEGIEAPSNDKVCAGIVNSDTFKNMSKPDGTNVKKYVISGSNVAF
ncbi:type II secretion system GspH family protein [Campylobacter sp. VBCF_05 NA6]|uniref:type II secretion system protein n=1 Tax=unclassified Campylobacter TaxID=2593542 RepID=UPI0022E9B426|nr:MULTISPECIES: type II secretion system protein [unclassified Campylobacter]MDA3057757.1 type II secretion system GspH family protein [Campylobacter sp. VBCF_04 NA7]MDA3058869.1 type II secretion system GspH family protein [Campylobacter sp. VBCF_05 NA6]